MMAGMVAFFVFLWVLVRWEFEHERIGWCSEKDYLFIYILMLHCNVNLWILKPEYVIRRDRSFVTVASSAKNKVVCWWYKTTEMISPFEQLIDNRTESSIDNPFLATTTSPLSVPIAQSINPSTLCLPTTFLRLPLPQTTESSSSLISPCPPRKADGYI